MAIGHLKFSSTVGIDLYNLQFDVTCVQTKLLCCSINFSNVRSTLINVITNLSGADTCQSTFEIF